MERDTTLT